MDQILKTITDLIGSVWDSPIVQLGVRAIALYVVVLWLAAAYWAFRDMQLRSANPIVPYFAASLVIVFTPIFFPFAVIAYRIVRPQEKIGEVYERTLAEEALLAEVEAVHSCPTCARRVNDEWIVCPTCRTRLSRVCPNCGRLVGMDWALCAWCGRDFDRLVQTPEPLTAMRPTPSLEAMPAIRSMASIEPQAYAAAGSWDGGGRDYGLARHASTSGVDGVSTLVGGTLDTQATEGTRSLGRPGVRSVDRGPDRPVDRLSDRGLDRSSDRARDDAPERLSDRALDRRRDRVTDLALDSSAERPTDSAATPPKTPRPPSRPSRHGATRTGGPSAPRTTPDPLPER